MLNSRLRAKIAEREAVADWLLARRPLLAEIVEQVQKYAALNAERRKMERAGLTEADLGIDLSPPLVPSPRPPRSVLEERLGHVPGDLARGLRIPGIAARGDVAPDWLYRVP